MSIETFEPKIHKMPATDAEFEQKDSVELREIKESLGIVRQDLSDEREQVIEQASAEKKEQLLNTREALEKHEDNVLYYASILSDLEGLSVVETDLALIATQLHDSAKLTAPLLEHHLVSVELAKKILDKHKGEKLRSIVIDDKIIGYIQDAIKRHQNHPFLVALNKGQKFEEPITNIDKVVFDADMLSNIGFKNIAFRLNSKEFLKQDIKNAADSNSIIIETFNNVMQGVRELPNTILGEQAKELANTLVVKIDKIFKTAKPSIMDCQSKYVTEGHFSADSIVTNGGVAELIKDLNEIISQATQSLGESDLVKKFLI